MTDPVRPDDSTSSSPRAHRNGGWRSRLTRPSCALFALPLLVPAFFVIERAGLDVSGWLGEVAHHLRSIPPHLIIIAVLLKGGESALTSLAWTHVLRATYPERSIPYRLVLAGYQGGVALNVVAPAKAGTLATFGLFRLRIRGARIPTLISTFAVNSIAFTAFAVVNVLAVFALYHATIIEHLSAAWGPVRTFLGDHPALLAVLVIGVIAIVVLSARLLRSEAGEFREQIVAGGAILREPRRYAIRVFLPALGSYACRWGYSAVFMAAFDIPVTFQTVLLFLGSGLVSSLIALTPGGFGINQAVDVAVMSAYAPAEVITAASLAQDVIFKAWNLLFGLAVAAWAFGWRGTKALIHRRDDLAEEAAGGADADPQGALAVSSDPPSGSSRL